MTLLCVATRSLKLQSTKCWKSKLVLSVCFYLKYNKTYWLNANATTNFYPLQAATASTGDSLNVAINSIYLRMITSVGSKEEGELLTKMKEAYGNKELRRQSLKNCSFDARLDMLKVSCQLLDDYKIEEEDFSVLNRLVSDILAMQSNLVGNLEDCIKRVIRFYKRKYQKDQSDLGEKNDMRPNYFHKNMQTVILLIVRLSEGQLQRGKKFKWQG